MWLHKQITLLQYQESEGYSSRNRSFVLASFVASQAHACTHGKSGFLAIVEGQFANTVTLTFLINVFLKH